MHRNRSHLWLVHLLLMVALLAAGRQAYAQEDYGGSIAAPYDYGGSVSDYADYGGSVAEYGDYGGSIAAPYDYGGSVAAYDGYDYGGAIAAEDYYGGSIVAPYDYGGSVSGYDDYGGSITAPYGYGGSISGYDYGSVATDEGNGYGDALMADGCGEWCYTFAEYQQYPESALDQYGGSDFVFQDAYAYDSGISYAAPYDVGMPDYGSSGSYDSAWPVNEGFAYAEQSYAPVYDSYAYDWYPSGDHGAAVSYGISYDHDAMRGGLAMPPYAQIANAAPIMDAHRTARYAGSGSVVSGTIATPYRIAQISQIAAPAPSVAQYQAVAAEVPTMSPGNVSSVHDVASAMPAAAYSLPGYAAQASVAPTVSLAQVPYTGIGDAVSVAIAWGVVGTFVASAGYLAAYVFRVARARVVTAPIRRMSRSARP